LLGATENISLTAQPVPLFVDQPEDVWPFLMLFKEEMGTKKKD
jgi:hypothetical protein